MPAIQGEDPINNGDKYNIFSSYNAHKSFQRPKNRGVELLLLFLSGTYHKIDGSVQTCTGRWMVKTIAGTAWLKANETRLRTRDRPPNLRL